MALTIEAEEVVVRIMTITLHGRLDAAESAGLRIACERFISDGHTHFVFDLEDVTMMDSAGLAVLVSVLKHCRQRGGDVRLVWPKTEIAARILKLTRFDQVFASISRSAIVPPGI